MKFAGGVGYANIDLIYSGLTRLPGRGEEVFSGGFKMQLGGGIPGTMANLSRLGVPSRILTFMGDDLFSDYVRKTLGEFSAETINLYEGKGMPVIISSALLYEQDRSFVSYFEKQEVTPSLKKRIYENLSGASVVEMQGDFLDVYKMLKEEGTILTFDTGWEDDLSLEKYSEYLKLADYYLPNQKEALKITGTDSVQDAAEVLSMFFSEVIIKLDKEGCYLKDGNGERIVSPMPEVKAVDPTGAGDAFMSGFIYGLIHDYSTETCVRFGNVSGGICVQGMGCLSEYVTEKELLKIADTLSIREI